MPSQRERRINVCEHGHYDFGPNLQAALDQRAMTQTHLASHLGVTQTAVSYWCGGTREPNLAMLCRIADMFEVSVDRLLGRDVDAVDHVDRLRQIAAEQKRLADELVTLYGPIEVLARAAGETP